MVSEHEPTLDAAHGLVQLYTLAMLAELVGVRVAVARRWLKRGWLAPVREVRRLAYFDFQEIATARTLAELHAAGTSPMEMEKYLEALVGHPDEMLTAQNW